MENFSLDRLLILLLFLLLPLLNWLLKQLLAKRRDAGRAAEERPVPSVPVGAPQSTPKPEKFVRERVIAPPTLRTPPHRSRSQTMRLLLSNKRDVRRGIVLMTVLGPCRGLEPRE